MRSSRIRDQVGVAAKDPDFVPKMMTLSKGESDKSADPITHSVAIAKSPPKAAAKEKKKVTPKTKGNKTRKESTT